MNYKHGLSKHPIFNVWNHMIQRCYNPNCRAFKNYGARGISVCAEWKDSPVEFIKWSEQNGWDPKLEIDRIDNDGDYSPENCRYVTHSENNKNKRPVSEELCKLRSERLMGHPVSQETKEKIRKIQLGKRHSVESRLKQTRSRGGNLPPGVQKIKNRFRARAHIDGKRVSLGCFATAEEASSAYQQQLRSIK